MAKNGDNGSQPRVMRTRRSFSRKSRSNLSKRFFADRFVELQSKFPGDQTTIEEAFQKGNTDSIRRFTAMYGKDATVYALVELGINVHWELRNYQEVVRDSDTTPSLRLEALGRIQAIRATVFDNRVAPTSKRPTSAAEKAEKEIPAHVRDEADSAGEVWGPKEKN